MAERARITRRIIVDAAGCWIWQGAISDTGYGNLSLDGTVMSAHRASYLLFVGPVPEGCDLHHTCEVRACVNPSHLTPIDRLAHRAEHPAPPTCPKGHTEFRMKGRWRDCKVCHRERERERARRKALTRAVAVLVVAVAGLVPTVAAAAEPLAPCCDNFDQVEATVALHERVAYEWGVAGWDDAVTWTVASFVATLAPPAPTPASSPASTVAPSSGGGGSVSIDRWMALHNCEQPDSWTVHGRFGNGLMGGGGLGISDGAWAAWGGLAYGPYAGAATPDQQMAVAQVGYDQSGGSPWSCRF